MSGTGALRDSPVTQDMLGLWLFRLNQCHQYVCLHVIVERAR